MKRERGREMMRGEGRGGEGDERWCGEESGEERGSDEVRRRKSEEEREVMKDGGKGVMRKKVKKGDDVRVGVTVSQ